MVVALTERAMALTEDVATTVMVLRVLTTEVRGATVLMVDTATVLMVDTAMATMAMVLRLLTTEVQRAMVLRLLTTEVQRATVVTVDKAMAATKNPIANPLMLTVTPRVNLVTQTLTTKALDCKTFSLPKKK